MPTLVSVVCDHHNWREDKGFRPDPSGDSLSIGCEYN